MHIPIQRERHIIRFLKSCFTTTPACVMQFGHPQVVELLRNHMQDYISNLSDQNAYVLLEDVTPLVVWQKLGHLFAELSLATRSHNVLSMVFETFCKQGPLFSRLAWWIERTKIYYFERKAMEVSDKFWAITDQDQAYYSKLFNLPCDGVLGVDIALDKYEKTQQGDWNNILFLGFIDFRKGYGMQKFISESWPRVYQKLPTAQLLLAGKNTDTFSNPKQGIQGVGFIDDDVDFLSKGMIFVNPHQNETGIKLKSLVAMASGKLLISSKAGVEGIPGEHGKHYLVAKK